jgi:hypothetical protein
MEKRRVQADRRKRGAAHPERMETASATVEAVRGKEEGTVGGKREQYLVVGPGLKMKNVFDTTRINLSD